MGGAKKDGNPPFDCIDAGGKLNQLQLKESLAKSAGFLGDGHGVTRRPSPAPAVPLPPSSTAW